MITDELWELLKPLLPPSSPVPHGRTGRLRRDDRAVLEGIVFVLSTGIGWAKSPAGGSYPHPAERGYGSGGGTSRAQRGGDLLASAAPVAAGGVWDQLHAAVLDRLGQGGLLDWLRASIDAVSVRADT